MTINNAVDKYQASRCEDAFSELYAHIYGGSRKIVRMFARRYAIDEHDVESMINEKLYAIAGKYSGTSEKFKNAVFSAVKLGCIDLARKRTREDGRTTDVMYEDEDGTQNELYEIIEVAPTISEDFIVEEIQKKHDQRQLIAFLISNADEPTLTSASAFIETDSYRKAAKQIGTSDKTVKSRIRKLAKRYDEKRFGSYYDYFTAPTEYVG